MPVETPLRASQPFTLEQVIPPSTYLSGGSEPFTYVNKTGETIVPGEPVVFCDRICVSKKIILPNKIGSLVYGAVNLWLVDPNLVEEINQGDDVWFDYDLADDDSPIGYATNVEPTNGLFLGHALVHPGGRNEDYNVPAGYAGEAQACAGGGSGKRVAVLGTIVAPDVNGTIPTFV